ncbi:unnamed protein product [Prunus armeniaca]
MFAIVFVEKLTIDIFLSVIFFKEIFQIAGVLNLFPPGLALLKSLQLYHPPFAFNSCTKRIPDPRGKKRKGKTIKAYKNKSNIYESQLVCSNRRKLGPSSNVQECV